MEAPREPRGYYSRIPDYGMEAITVLVGEEKKSFHVHKDIICSSSDLIAAAMRNDCEESRTLTVKFPEESGEIFAIYHHWLYTELVCAVTTDQRGAARWHAREEMRRLAQAYVLGEVLQDYSFALAVMSCMLEHQSQDLDWGLEIFEIIYEGTPSISAGRKYLVDRIISEDRMRPDSTWLERMRRHLPYDFMLELATKLLWERSNREPIEISDDDE